MAVPAFDHSTETPAPGALLCSKYRLVQELGAGGMGTVWLARNESLGKDVAVKLLRAGIDAPDAAERFVREARAAASIDHPAIVSVFDYGTTESGQPFIVMERLEGENLAELIERSGPLSAIEVVRAMLPVIDGLALAHAQGVVHRDLKPANVFLAREGGHPQPKVLDFGVAKLQEQDADLQLTRQGTVVGSPAYMAPEQAQGLGDVDARADIWAVCVVIYEAVSGRTPFDGNNYNAILAAILVDEVPPFRDPRGEEGLAEVLAVGLRKEREHRFQSMRELGEALAAYLIRHGVHDDVRGVPLSAVWPAAARLAARSSSVRPQGNSSAPPPEMWASDVVPKRGGGWAWVFFSLALLAGAGGIGYALWLDASESLYTDLPPPARESVVASQPTLPLPVAERERKPSHPAPAERAGADDAKGAKPAREPPPSPPPSRGRAPASLPAPDDTVIYPVPRAPDVPPAEAVSPPPEPIAPPAEPEPARPREEPAPPAPTPSPSLDLKDPY